MSEHEHEPIRLRDDPTSPAAVRRDLAIVSRAGAVAVAVGFDPSAALARFEATRANSPSQSANTARGTMQRTARWWGVGAIGLATFIALAAWGAYANRPSNTPPVVSVAAHTSRDARGTQTSASSAAHPAPLAATGMNPSEVTAANTRAPGSPARDSHEEPSNALVPVAAPMPLVHNASTHPNPSTSSPSVGAGIDAPPSSGRASIANLRAAGPGVDLLGRDSRMLTDTYAILVVDPAGALVLANRGIREFPASPHLEEREAMAVQSLVALHRMSEARARGERFLSHWPSGPYAGVVRQALYSTVRDQ